MIDLGSTTFDGLVVRLALVALLGAAAWGVVIAAALAVEVLSRGRVTLARRVGCPAGLRRVVLVACGVAVVAAAAPSYAAGEREALDGLPLPDRPTGSVVVRPLRGHAVHVVRPGECLWSIAVGRGADDPARLAARIYALNRRTIGADPDLIQPGQRLILPASNDPTEEVDR
jgi:hypothetical protein